MQISKMICLPLAFFVFFGCKKAAQDSHLQRSVKDPTASVSYLAIDTILEQSGYHFIKLITRSPMPESLFIYVPDIQYLELSADSGVTIFKTMVAIPDSLKQYRGTHQFTSTLMTSNVKKYQRYRFWKDSATYVDTVLQKKP